MAHEPHHSTNKAFFAGREVLPGVWVECHMSRATILQKATTLLTHCGVAFEVLVGGDD